MRDRHPNSYSLQSPDLAQENGLVLLKPFTAAAQETILSSKCGPGRVTETLSQLLTQHVRGTNCQISLHPSPVHIKSASAYYYPDLVVSYDPRDRQANCPIAEGVIQYPCLIIDVISDPFLTREKQEQFDHYRQIETLEEYVWLDPTQPKLECFRKIQPGVWEQYRYELGHDVYLDSLSFLIEIEAIYKPVLIGSRKG